MVFTCNIAHGQKHPTISSVICNSRHPLFYSLNNFLKSKNSSDTFGCMVCSCLLDSTYIGYQYYEYGIYRFGRDQFPSPGVYLFYKNKNKPSIKIIKKYNLTYLQRRMRAFFRKNNVPKNEQVKYLYGFALFYDDYVYTKYKIGLEDEKYDY